MKIAIVFFGQPRNIQNRMASISHKFWARKLEVDFYGHCWFEPSGAKAYSGGEHARNFKISAKAPELLRKQYPSISLCIEEPKTVEELMEKVDLDKDEKVKILVENPLLPVFISQFYSISQALNHFDMQSVGKEYDFIVLSRYDNFVALLPKAQVIETGKLTMKGNSGNFGFPDLVFIGPRYLLEKINIYPVLGKYLKSGKRLTPELLKQEHFLTVSTESTLTHENFEILVVRDSKCFKYLSYFSRVRLKHYKIKYIFRWLK